MSVRSLGLCALLAALLAAGSVRAAPPDEDEKETAAGSNAEAKKRFAEGNDKYSRGDYEGASESFKAAIAADPKLPGPYRNLGLCYRALNRCADALPMYERYLELKPESRFTERVRREMDLCRAKLGQITSPPAGGQRSGGGGGASNNPHPVEAQSILHVAANLIGGEATDEATVKVDGLVRGATPLTIPVTPGKHKINLTRAGFESAATTIDVAPGDRKDVELTMNKIEMAPLPPVANPAHDAAGAAAAAEAEAQRGPRPSYKKYGWILIGVAAAAAAVGAGFGIAESALHRDAVAAPPAETMRSDVDNKHDRGDSYAAITYTGLGVGGAALMAAAIVFIIDPSKGENHERQKYLVMPSVGRQGGGLLATVRF
jgi:hypothetical protein